MCYIINKDLRVLYKTRRKEMSNGKILYWLAKHPDCDDEYVGLPEGITLLFSNEKTARIQLDANGFKEAKLYKKNKSQLIAEFGKKTLVIFEPDDNSSAEDAIEINELPEYNM